MANQCGKPVNSKPPPLPHQMYEMRLQQLLRWWKRLILDNQEFVCVCSSLLPPHVWVLIISCHLTQKLQVWPHQPDQEGNKPQSSSFGWIFRPYSKTWKLNLRWLQSLNILYCFIAAKKDQGNELKVQLHHFATCLLNWIYSGSYFNP